MHARLAELVQYADTQREVLLRAVDGVPASLHERRPDPQSWSVAEVLDHLHRVEAGVAKLLDRRVAQARETGLGLETEAASMLGSLDALRITERLRRVPAPNFVLPRSDARAAEARDALRVSRASLRAALESGGELALGEIVHPHPLFGPLNLYQWLLFVGQHEGRHAFQVREIGEQLAAG